MTSLALQLAIRLRPRFGWLQTALALIAALCVSLIAGESELRLPTGLFFMAGIGGCMVGFLVGRRDIHRRLVVLTLGVVVIVVAGMLLLAAGESTPPIGLLLADMRTYGIWVVRIVRGSTEPPSASGTGRFFAVALPDLWARLNAAPNAGETGARLIVAVSGTIAVWLSALMMGWAVAAQRRLFGWSLPLVATLTGMAAVTNNSGQYFVTGLVCIFLLECSAQFQRREHQWQQSRTDYSGDLRNDTLIWGSLLTVVIITVALILPTSLRNPLASLLWRDVDLPSGIEVLNRNAAPPPVRVQIALSTLPAVPLGVSLERQAPETLALRVQLAEPLVASQTPRYWRARLLNRYTGTGWTTNARIAESNPPLTIDPVVPGFVAQTIEDFRSNRTVLVGLPEIISMDTATTAERLSSGAVAALTSEEPPERYRVVSRPQDLQAVPDQPSAAPPPDFSDTLALPANLPPRVTNLTRAIVGDTSMQREQAKAIEAYLRSLPYAYEVRPLQPGSDAVDQFLFDMRSGYCTYYASSMAIMARILGIPARVAVGYATGTYDEVSRTYTVRESDAHAWPELYIEGRWTAFEPTSIRPLPARGATSPAPIPQPAPASTPAQPSLPVPWLVLSVVSLVLLGIGVWWWRTKVPPVELAQRQLERAGARLGAAWPAGATVREYADTLAPQLGDAAALQTVVGLIERQYYSSQPLNASELQQLVAASHMVKTQVRRSLP